MSEQQNPELSETAAPQPKQPSESELVAAAHVAVMHLHNQAVLASQLSDSPALSAAKATVKALRDAANKACEAAGM